MRFLILLCLPFFTIVCEECMAASMQIETAETTAAAEGLGALNATASLECGKLISGVAPLLVPGTIDRKSVV